MNENIEQLATRIDDLERRLRRLDDIEAIKQLHRRYIRMLADRKWDEMADLFTDDAVTDIRSHGRTEGRQALVEKVFGELKGFVKSSDGYILSSPVIEIGQDPETAYGEWTWHRHVCEFRIFGGYTRVWGPWMEGRYRCHYQRVDGEWKFKDMWFRVVLPDADPEYAEMQEWLASSEPHVLGKGMIRK